VASLFKSNLNIYEVHNNGGWYNFGFLFGLACFFRWRRQPGSASEVTLDAAHRLITKKSSRVQLPAVQLISRGVSFCLREGGDASAFSASLQRH
jgi:hypothetical protein